MAPWIIPALKAVLPHVGTIVSAAKPIFTKTSADAAGLSANAPVQQQIDELQAVAAQNDAHIRELAAQLQTAVTALEEAALAADAKAQRLLRLCVTAMGISVLAACISLILVVGR
ncbi:hypothetical protein [Noviherbaspirillum sedimenti]|uniref:Uncharacterized protein n=1 Tax=Noviherbaspirillum sedimenti TaxID=2320865 RepID=A0A3A3G3P8_9BURK|nr:hypothetical protein [Noviherbaspirillum sedimenti]RJG02474.1 hypothetical protein D3878_13535 [Noviherbaspirillum sedimenti]